MALLKGRLFSGELFAGALWGITQVITPPTQHATGGGGGGEPFGVTYDLRPSKPKKVKKRRDDDDILTFFM